MAASASPTSEKGDVSELESAQRENGVKEAQSEPLHGKTTLPANAQPDFSHLDEKKILRKVCTLEPTRAT